VELSVSLDFTGTGKPHSASFDLSTPGKLKLKGHSKIDWTPALLHASIALDTFRGRGKIELVPNWKKTVLPKKGYRHDYEDQN